MTLWDLNRAPMWPKVSGRKTPILTSRGWEDPETGEVLVAMGGRTDDAGPSDVVDVTLDKSAYVQGDPILVSVIFNEAVDVIAGATIELSWSGVSGNFFCTVPANVTGVNEVVFQGVIPAEAGVLQISTGAVLSGDFFDAGTAVAANISVPTYLDAYFTPITVA